MSLWLDSQLLEENEHDFSSLLFSSFIHSFFILEIHDIDIDISLLIHHYSVESANM